MPERAVESANQVKNIVGNVKSKKTTTSKNSKGVVKKGKAAMVSSAKSGIDTNKSIQQPFSSPLSGSGSSKKRLLVIKPQSSSVVKKEQLGRSTSKKRQRVASPTPVNKLTPSPPVVTQDMATESLQQTPEVLVMDVFPDRNLSNLPLTPKQKHLIEKFKASGMALDANNEVDLLKAVNDVSIREDDKEMIPTVAQSKTKLQMEVPILSLLSNEGCNFIWSIFGHGEHGEFLPSPHNECPLHDFIKLFDQQSFKAVASSKCNNGHYRLTLRYFGGLFCGDTQPATDDLSISVSHCLVKFLTDQFN